MELNEFEYQMLDALLESFGPDDELTRPQVLELFGGDESFAASMISVLAAEGLVLEKGLEAGQVLPGRLRREAKATGFLEKGGFAGKAAETLENSGPSWPAWNEETLLRKNTELQNETLRLQRTLRDMEGELRSVSEEAARASLYRKAFYAALAVVVLLLGWIIWLLLHRHR